MDRKSTFVLHSVKVNLTKIRASMDTENKRDDRPDYICSWCNRSLAKISDRLGNNQEWFCRNCDIAYSDTEQLRRRQKISVPARNQDPLVALTPGTEYLNKKIKIRHEPEFRGGIAELAKGTIRITKFEGSSQRWEHQLLELGPKCVMIEIMNYTIWSQTTR